MRTDGGVSVSGLCLVWMHACWKLSLIAIALWLLAGWVRVVRTGLGWLDGLGWVELG